MTPPRAMNTSKAPARTVTDPDWRFRHTDRSFGPMRTLYELACERAGVEALDDSPPQAVREPGEPAASPLDPVALLQHNQRLPSLPQAMIELQRAIDDPKSSSADLGRAISLDPGLSALVLRLVNSAFYGFSQPIDTVSRAVTVVGTAQLSTLALGLGVVRSLENAGSGAVDLEDFWDHSMAVGLMARDIAQKAGFEEPERYFVAGLLHDVGRIALFQALGEKGTEIVSLAGLRAEPLFWTEKSVLGFDHASFGSMLLRKWNLPFSLALAVLHHHTPDKAADHLEPSLVHVADVVAKGLGHAATAEYFVPPLSPDAWKRTTLYEEDLARLARLLDNELDQVLDIFLGRR